LVEHQCIDLIQQGIGAGLGDGWGGINLGASALMGHRKKAQKKASEEGEGAHSA
jgi:hypothetical protein